MAISPAYHALLFTSGKFEFDFCVWQNIRFNIVTNSALEILSFGPNLPFPYPFIRSRETHFLMMPSAQWFLISEKSFPSDAKEIEVVDKVRANRTHILKINESVLRIMIL